ncbi:conserved Plasmodium protein, unknown function [Plasmodium berghei]|uniref:Uncharacterized protein n=2 Tax=Plasmodium berghei TaxID=5821 RepID=A0A509AQZ5_PLABA|nr:conserved Plasmodium protein, unknown function [Plasmodium berghei ANKA]CXJ24405.1 conserved Plasmodium protein, unknown function [Plasmodium berghei]SCM26791.1 conserved Plasmodium protein, unknown function [Plasmodium berghei]SCN28639.1 conserved Plasmodium protein, unknown function [Plasmodium berghei]SCO62845.1 conserved Plasmodium protein, unknown function [Plasmodium berghei]SCO64387.1 conserved Plasmodium protein, unknown function [Plasmodium berghei]|eukprot:XP_034424283.1 conserved Plasmodium protein, unknown function [Plasmodium berghei ANKA]
MLWEQFLSETYKLLWEKWIKLFIYNIGEVKETTKMCMHLIFQGYFSKIINTRKIHLVNLYVKYICNHVITKFGNKQHKGIKLKNPISDLFSKYIMNKKIEKNTITLYSYKKKSDLITSDVNYSTKKICPLESSDEHCVINLYNEIYPQDELNTSLNKEKPIKCESNCNITEYSEYEKCYESDKATNSSSCFGNSMLNFETLEYDEDEVNENIKNCYLYNGYINASMYKKSGEYKFLKNHLNEDKNITLNIEIDASSQSYNEETDQEGKLEGNYEKNNHELNEEYKRGIRVKKKKIYEIYNTETTTLENMYYENYLNENYSSSYGYTSDNSDDINESDFIDNDFNHNNLNDKYQQNSWCQYNINKQF